MGGGVSRHRAAALAALGLVLALLPVPYLSAADPSASIVNATFTPVDADGNGLTDYLNVTLSLSMAQSGNLRVNATLVWPAGNTTITSTTALAQPPAGVSFFTLRLEGPSIAEKQLDGPFDLRIQMVSSPSGPFSENASFQTPGFRASEFESAPLGAKPRLRVTSDAIQVTTPAMNATIGLHAATLRWGPPGGPDLEWTAIRAVAFADDGDHAFEPTEEVCAADFEAAPWALSALDVGPSAELGTVVRVELRAPAAFNGTGCAVPVSFNATLSFLIAERNGTVEGPLPAPLTGGLEVKVDVRLALDAPLPGSDLTIEANLRAIGAPTSYLVPGPSGHVVFDPHAGSGEIPAAPLANRSTGDVERILSVNAGGAVVGTFAWRALGDESLGTGQARFAQVTPSIGAHSGDIRLFLSAPSGPQLAQVGFGALAGTVVNAAPPPLGSPPPPPPPAAPSALVFAAALAAVAAMFFFSVYARAKKY